MAGLAMRTTDGMRGFHTQLFFQRRDKNFEKVQKQRILLAQHRIDFRVHHGHHNQRPDAALFAYFADAIQAFRSLFRIIYKWEPYLAKVYSVELGKQSLAQNFGSDTGSIRNIKDCAA